MLRGEEDGSIGDAEEQPLRLHATVRLRCLPLRAKRRLNRRRVGLSATYQTGPRLFRASPKAGGILLLRPKHKCLMFRTDTW